MNFIYDVIADFNVIPYDFFEWNKIDNITHLKKVLIIKTKREIINDLIYKKVKISDELLEMIKNKTEFYSKPDSEYIVIFTDSYINICIKFTKEGINKYKSFLQIEEDEEVLDLSERMKETDFSYQVFGENYIECFKTRKEIEISNYVLNKIISLYENDEITKLKYIYYDCFEEVEVNKNKIFERIKQEIDNNNNCILNKIYDFFRLISVKID